jgi:hypothetical protein
MCWTSFQTRRRGTTIVIGICIGGGGSTSGRRLRRSGRRCVSRRRCGGAGSLSGRRRLINCCSVLKPSCSSTERPGAPEPSSPGARTPYILPFSRGDQTVAPDLGPWGALGPVPVGGPSPRAFRRLSRARTRPAGTGGANRYMNRHHTHGCSKMGSMPATPSKSARRTGPRVGVAGLKGLPTLFRVAPVVLRPVSDSGGTYEFSRKTRTNGCTILKREDDNAPLDHFRMAR